jgi:hypothetical protein
MSLIKFSDNERSHYSGPFSAKAIFKSPEEEHEWAAAHSKTCNKCHTELPYTCFGFNTSGQDPFDKNGYRLKRGECEDCNKQIAKGKNEAKKMAKQQGITYKAPEGTCCEICGSQDKIVFDHHHQQNIFRGWLCNGCNRSIGMLGESLESAIKVVNYLNKTDKKKLEIDSESGLLKEV